MEIINHPRELLQQDWIDILRNYSEEAEQNGILHPKQIQLLFNNNWLKALTAKDYGGLEWSLPQIVSFEEAIGWADGSAGWVFTLCSGAAWFSGFLNRDFANKIFSEKNVCLAGSGAASGIAKKINDENYLVSGSWKYASGAPFATVFTANCVVEDEQKIKAFCFLKDEVTISKTWNSIGLIASSSESFSVNNVVIPKERCFEIDANKTIISSPLYQYPFLQLAESTIAANVSGMALHFIEECESLFKEKKYRGGNVLWENKNIQSIFQKEKSNWQNARNQLHKSVEISWNELLDKHTISDENLQEVSNASQKLAKVCRQIVNNLYPLTGLTGANRNADINRVWRDFQTGSQHAIFMDV
ncbi:hypothetical protein A9P82_09060 [Arachidicoccus ginsenosidimutans]|uniref:hypothetical protein n=1 Tax=Arachidicoccus sp. BS20 TaxID=1850526 RepID=UPI0007F08FB8|nr:hypothetical protein [Arachidicoccus sp. BS20]ANI90698.1 hypothetical protein A9P82_09060 [Arachidicoccus sp. BS20]